MSLLRRIEQGQNSGGNQQPQTPGQGSSKPAGETPASGSGSGDSSRLSSLQARRVSAPATSPQAGSYFDFKDTGSKQITCRN